MSLSMHRERLFAGIDRMAGRHSPQLAAGSFNFIIHTIYCILFALFGSRGLILKPNLTEVKRQDIFKCWEYIRMYDHRHGTNREGYTRCASSGEGECLND